MGGDRSPQGEEADKLQSEIGELSEFKQSPVVTRQREGARISASARRLLTVLVDLACGGVAVLLALIIRFDSLPDARYNGIVAAVLPLVWITVLAGRGSYDTRWLTSGAEPFRRVLESGLIVLGGAAMISFLAHAELSRVFVGVSAVLMTVLTLGTRYAARKQLHGMLGRGRTIHEVVVAGSLGEVTRVVAHMRREPYAGFKVVAACILDHAHEDVTAVDGIPARHSDIDGLEGAVDAAGADTLALAGTSTFPTGTLRRLSWRLEGKPVQLIVVPALTDFAGPRIAVRPVGGLPLLHIDEPEFKGLRRALKQLLDVSLAGFLLILLSPLMIGIAIAIRLGDRGPVFFRQTRVGRHGRPFEMWKFRTMVVDSEERLKDLLGLNEHSGVLFKIRQDPRVTRVGAVLRKYSLDEMPQFFNVVGGSMSMVGPRPPLAREVELYGEEMRRRLLVKPGMTGLWQINGRSDLAWDEAVRLDLYYVENWSPVLDFMVLWKTLAVVLRGHGGY